MEKYKNETTDKDGKKITEELKRPIPSTKLTNFLIKQVKSFVDNNLRDLKSSHKSVLEWDLDQLTKKNNSQISNLDNQIKAILTENTNIDKDREKLVASVEVKTKSNDKLSTDIRADLKQYAKEHTTRSTRS
ncbi:hypothetical protein LFWB_1630 [Candidatus Phytoplasma luffae]|uniref:Uncharacterized protein n=1 Tax=Loofah witches'-broom phytoplasma TaxID=35773 RepID=A0A975FI12_LOWBP|nr:hypothetical protein [Candidatus Phytoplasma luffae]QTX02733.1 hypothetical protein LFWB_1630 [Candidatus Phytoplasma luffae]